MKTRDYDMSINLMDAEMTSVMEKLSTLDSSSSEYEQTAKNLKLIQESKQMEVKNRSEHRSGSIPQWGTWLAGAACSLLLGVGAMWVDKTTGMPPIQGVNFWDKFRPKF